ncbi:hypothetical protein SLE2022_377100 [Rubroshorea leprosula]
MRESTLVVTMVMVMVECFDVGLNTLSKAAMARGMSDFVFVVYSNAFALLILLPSSFFFYRKRIPTPAFSIICKIFLLSMIGSIVQLCMYTGIGYSSPTLASALSDLTPAFAFLLAIICRMEKIDLRMQSSLAKSIGTIVSIGGALTVTLYKGPSIIFTSSPNNLPNELHLSIHLNWVIGGILLATGSFLLALLFILQTSIIREYSEVLMVTVIACLFTTIQSAAIGLIAERDMGAWTLKPDMELIAIGYSAVFALSARNIVYTWACRVKGPVYVCMFKPLGIVIAFLMGVTFLGDTLYLGSVVGGIIITFGFYAVIWGKAKEEKTTEDKSRCNLNSSPSKVPLLQNNNTEV